LVFNLCQLDEAYAIRERNNAKDAWPTGPKDAFYLNGSAVFQKMEYQSATKVDTRLSIFRF
jgi:hypothetical protein